MMNIRLRTVTLCIATLSLFFPQYVLHALPSALIRSSHDAAVSAYAKHAEKNLLFTAGTDGKLMVWNVATDQLIQSIRADRLPLRTVILYPDGERVALYASDGRREHRISVWNWASGERVYLHTPDDEVLWMDISPQGSYLLYSVPSLRSVRMLDAATGRQLPFLRQPTGIVSWFVPATSEERVMTYAPSSGAITYRNIVTGTVAGSFEGPPDVKNLTLLEQRRYAAVETSSGMLGVMDLLSGELVTEVRAGEILSIHRDSNRNNILVYSRSIIGSRTIRRYRFENGRLQQRFETRRSISDDITGITFYGSDLFGSDNEGRLYRWSGTQSNPSVFADSLTQPVTDLYFTGDRLFLLTTDALISIASDFFREMQRSEQQSVYVEQRVSRIEAGRNARLVPTGGESVLLWTPMRSGDPLTTFDPLTAHTSPLPVTVPPGIVSLSAYENEVLLLTRAGLLQLLDVQDGRELFSYRGTGFQTAIRTEREIFLGKAYERGVLDSSILRIDPRTGQTVPMDTEARLVFAFTYDHRRGRLFSIGVVSDPAGNISTVVEVFDGPNYGRRRTILEIPGEYLDAQVVVDSMQGTAYTTLDDRGGILRWDGTRVTELSRNQAHIPRHLVLNNDYVFSVNWDGTVSLLDRFDGETVIDIVVIRRGPPGTWVAMRPDGRFYLSRETPDGDKLISINDGADMGDLMLEHSLSPQRSSDDRPGAPTPRDRFETGRSRDPAVEEGTDQFDPATGDPAPSS